MPEFEIATANGPMPVMESKTINRYFVPVDADVKMKLTGEVEVYAHSEAEAIAKVQDQIDTDILNDDLEMKDPLTGGVLEYGLVKHIDGVNLEVNAVGVEINFDEVTLEQVLCADIHELESLIPWDAEALAKHKAFLESLSDSEAA
ncbi:MAG TPA: hypothetical protein VGK29_22715 [Paludibaculum sp.]|jgi:hypothetical protein